MEHADHESLCSVENFNIIKLGNPNLVSVVSKTPATVLEYINHIKSPSVVSVSLSAAAVLKFVVQHSCNHGFHATDARYWYRTMTWKSIIYLSYTIRKHVYTHVYYMDSLSSTNLHSLHHDQLAKLRIAKAESVDRRPRRCVLLT